MQLPGGILLLLEHMNNGILKCLNSKVMAIYVYGSLVMGDFVPQTSDIDFIVIVRTISQADAHYLKKLHDHLVQSHTYGRILEGDYIPLSHISLAGGSKTHVGYHETFSCDVPGDMISPDTLIAITEQSVTLHRPIPE